MISCTVSGFRIVEDVPASAGAACRLAIEAQRTKDFRVASQTHKRENDVRRCVCVRACVSVVYVRVRAADPCPPCPPPPNLPRRWMPAVPTLHPKGWRPAVAGARASVVPCAPNFLAV